MKNNHYCCTGLAQVQQTAQMVGYCYTRTGPVQVYQTCMLVGVRLTDMTPGLSVQCSLEVTSWERANLCDVLVWFVTFPCGVLGRACYLVVSIPDLCLLTYLERSPLIYLNRCSRHWLAYRMIVGFLVILGDLFLP